MVVEQQFNSIIPAVFERTPCASARTLLPLALFSFGLCLLWRPFDCGCFLVTVKLSFTCG